MILRTEGISIYHKFLDTETRLEKYETLYIPHCWYFIKQGSVIEDGIVKTDSVDVRIPLEYLNKNQIEKIAIGDLIKIGKPEKSILTKSEIKGNTFNISSITNNNFGKNAHLHLEG